MNKIKFILLVFLSLTLSNCFNETEENITKTKEELLTKKWSFNRFEFISSSNNTSNLTQETIETAINAEYRGNAVYEFLSDKTGKLTLNSELRTFNWSLTNNHLFLDFENDDQDTDYVLNAVSGNELNITFNHESTYTINGIEISVKGDYFYK